MMTGKNPKPVGFGIVAPLAALVLAAGALTAIGCSSEKVAEEAAVKKLTPVLIVEEIESSLPFWVDRLGFEKTAEVPEGDALGFVMLNRGEVQVMLQSRASVLKDIEALGKGPLANDGVGLFIEVGSLDDFLPKLEGLEVVVAERKTFYGAREIGVRAPGGITVMLAEFTEAEK